jgi:sugar O-acyltransferase (sialic acid O-acetyltransferase NeuD family)
MSAPSKQLVIFGTGEIASLARFYFEHDSPYKVHAFTADDAWVTATTFAGLPVVPFSRLAQRFPPSEFDLFIGLSYRRLNRLRREKFLMVKEANYRLASYVCSRSVLWPDAVIGENCLILENQTIQPGVKIGHNVIIWSGNHLGHMTTIGDHTYISSHVVLCGHVTIGPGCFLGVNAAVRDFVTIGEEVFVSMGATVAGDVPAGSVVVGPTGRVFSAGSRPARILKGRYFRMAEEKPDVAHSAT